MSTVHLLEKSNIHGENQLHYEPPALNGEEGGQEFLIFMITGNPGLISFYEPFLSTLHTLLASSASRFYISGCSLAGFHTSEGDLEGSPSSLIGLEGQIDHIEQKLFDQVDDLRGAEHISPKVILIGHSVGAYILLELIRQHQTKVEGGKKDFDLIGGILLFPTITHIAQSPQGMIYNVSLTMLSSPK
jgi:pimeloyl-ACP methyl ester carboxylesterase